MLKEDYEQNISFICNGERKSDHSDEIRPQFVCMVLVIGANEVLKFLTECVPEASGGDIDFTLVNTEIIFFQRYNQFSLDNLLL